MNETKIDIKTLATDLLSSTEKFAKAELAGIQHLAGDASSRRFIRLQLKKSFCSSVILMQLSGEPGPLVGGENYKTQDDSFVELAGIFKAQGLNVPEIYYDGRAHQMLLVEDLGSTPLWLFTVNQLDAKAEVMAQQLGENYLLELYRKALAQQKILSSCTPEVATNCLAFKRYLGFEQYRAEAERFITFYLEPLGVKKSAIAAISESLDHLCESVNSHPKTQIHRDFMPWNLFVRDSEVYVLDFQDSLQGSYVYDLMSLVHDRDADYAVGLTNCQKIIKIYQELHPNLPSEFKQHYHEALMQRYFRLAGQFHMLTKKTGNPIYQGWVPGCFRRLSFALAQTDYLQDVLNILYPLVGEIREGLSEPWDLFE